MFIEVSFKELTGAESAYSATCVNIVAASGYWVNSNMANPETHRATYLIAFIGNLLSVVKLPAVLSTTAGAFTFTIPPASEARIFAIAETVGALALIHVCQGLCAVRDVTTVKGV